MYSYVHMQSLQEQMQSDFEEKLKVAEEKLTARNDDYFELEVKIVSIVCYVTIKGYECF